MSKQQTLEDLTPGCRGQVVALTVGGDLGQRLMDLGFHPGVAFRVLRNAPLKDPMEIEVLGYCVSLRHSEAGFVEVRRQ